MSNGRTCHECREPALPGRSRCARHATRSRVQRRELYNQRVADGMCVDCGHPLDGDDDRRCVVCEPIERELRAIRYEELKRQWRCPRCRQRWEGDTVYCSECLAAEKQLYRSRYQRLKASGLCPTCRAKVPEENQTYCDACIDRARERKAQRERDADG